MRIELESCTLYESGVDQIDSILVSAASDASHYNFSGC